MGDEVGSVSGAHSHQLMNGKWVIVYNSVTLNCDHETESEAWNAYDSEFEHAIM